ncbi:hypothetical protein SAMN05216382_3012 [Sphingomonas palmae]|uniref:Uncharacterized protein n=1 Tax=Sphingomonas palmae TaxID=1855283 RepID=A0A1H7UIU1_9SPHN|nr:hypothetical protein [Sphingomonas palmae]SEL96953.1 hypothetical protein SAMN05216382_3012 [Sphingomonas palmae]
MRRLAAVLLIAGVGLGAGGAALAKRDTPELAYQKLIAGKVAGKPQSCIDTRFRQAQLSAYGDKLIYRVSDKLVYVSQTTGGCERVAQGDALVTRQYQTRTCSGDIATTVQPVPGITTGSCALGDFTPYTKP